MLIFLIVNFQVIYSDNENLGYVGHDLYFLNGFDVEVISKNIVIEIDEDRINFNGDYILRNQTEKITETIFGLPSDNIENLIIAEKSNIIKSTRRNRSYIEKNFIFEHLPKTEKWSTASLWLKANETRIINIKYESKTVNDSKGIYTFIYENNIEPNNLAGSKVYTIFNNFKPYNIINVYNIEVEKMYYNMEAQSILDGNINGRALRIDYELIDKLATDRLNFSTSKTLKNISNLFRTKDYEGVVLLCDEYISNPADSSVDINQVKFIKAEAYRKLIKYDNYFEIIKALDLNKLYPFRLKYKIFSDIDEILGGDINDPNLAIIMKSIQNDLTDSNEFFFRWNVHNKKDYSGVDDTIILEEEEEIKESYFDKFVIIVKFKNIIQFIKENEIIFYIILVLIFLFGFFIGRFSRKRKKDSPYYTLRR